MVCWLKVSRVFCWLLCPRSRVNANANKDEKLRSETRPRPGPLLYEAAQWSFKLNANISMLHGQNNTHWCLASMKFTISVKHGTNKNICSFVPLLLIFALYYVNIIYVYTSILFFFSFDLFCLFWYCSVLVIYCCCNKHISKFWQCGLEAWSEQLLFIRDNHNQQSLYRITHPSFKDWDFRQVTTVHYGGKEFLEFHGNPTEFV